MKITILGYGTFGSAIASRLILKGHEICKDKVSGSDIVFVSTPSSKVREALLAHKDQLTDQKIVICSKGFSDDGDLISNVLEKDFPNNSIYFLYGPTLAAGLINGEYSGMVLAGGEGLEELKKEIESPNLYVETSDDVIGVQVGATFKNVVNIFIGLVEGSNLGLNTEAFVYSKGLLEIQKLGVSLGAKPETFLGLACAGDLYLRSRNRLIGVEIGKGKSIEALSLELNFPKEGVSTLKNLDKIEKCLKVDLTFFQLIDSAVFYKVPIPEVIKKMSIIDSHTSPKRRVSLNSLFDFLNILNK